jgi:hypothetical protein
MAVLFTTVKNTNQETVIHFDTVLAESGTIALNSLTAATQALTSGGTPTVNITKIFVFGPDGSATRITRSGKNVFSCAPENAPMADYTENGWTDNINNTADIVIVNDTAKPVTGWLVLRKVNGWDTKVETAVYGQYDDNTRVGASTTMSGSPDKV